MMKKRLATDFDGYRLRLLLFSNKLTEMVLT